jgi:hypothetical protein
VREYGTDLPLKEAAEVKQRFERELIVMVQELRRLFPDVPLLPFAMHTYTRGGNDRIFFQRLFHNDPELLSAVQWKRSAPDEDFALFRRARGVVAMRFHSALLAIAARMPHVAIDYTHGGKIAALLGSVHAPPALPVEDFSGRECAARLLDVLHNPPPEPPSGVAEAYTAAWGRCLSLGRS